MSAFTKTALLSGFACLLAWGLGLYLTPLVIKAAVGLGIVARPDGKLRTQAEPVPYLGGVAVFLALLLALSISLDFSPDILGLLFGASIILLVGMIDDFGVMSARMKLFGQVVAALALIKADIHIELTVITGLAWPFDWPTLAWVLSALWLVGMANAMNFLDIEDGLAAGTAAGICPGLFVVALLNGRIDNAIFTAALFGAILGFLHFNAPTPTAKIYLGDAGSLLLGMTAAALAMLGIYTEKNVMAALCPVIIMGVPAFEMAVTMAARLRKGLPVWQGSPDHIAKRLQKAGLSKETTALLHALVSLALGGAAVFIMTADFLPALIAVAAIALVALVAAVILLRIPTD